MELYESIWKTYQGDITSAGWLMGIATLVVISALLLRLSGKNWGRENGKHLIYLVTAFLPLIPALYIALWQPINLWGGLAVIVVAAALVFGEPPRRRRRYRH